MSHNEASDKSISFALLANLGIAVNKTVAAVLTGSGAILAESNHSCADCRTRGLLFWGLRAAWGKPDFGHPLEYGMEIYFWLFIAAINGERVLQGASFLKDSLGQAFASQLLTIVDDGTVARGLRSAPFDGEGVPTQRHILVDKGVLKGFLYNTITARRAGVTSTGTAAQILGGIDRMGNNPDLNRPMAAPTFRVAEMQIGGK